MEGHEDNQIESFLNQLAINPMPIRIARFAGLIKTEILSSLSKASLGDAICKVICFPKPEMTTCFAQLLVELREGFLENWASGVSESVKLAANIALNQNDPANLRQQLGFLNEMLNQKLISGNVYLLYADIFFKSGDASLYLVNIFELIRNVDDLIKRNLLEIGIVELELWKYYTCHLAGVINKAMEVDPECGQALFEISDYLKWRGQCYKHIHGTACEHQPALYAEQEQFQLVVEDEKNLPVSTVNTIQGAGFNGLVKLLLTKPDWFKDIRAELRHRLLNCSYSRDVIKLVCEMLNEMCQTKPLPAVYSELLHSLRFLTINIVSAGGKSSTFGFFQAIQSWSSRQFGNLERGFKQVKILSKTLPLHNQLFKMKMLPSKMLLSYARKANNQMSPVALYFLYKIMKSADSLIDSGHLIFDDQTGSAWVGRHFFLRDAIDKRLVTPLVFPQIPKIVKFLQSVERKGGWTRKCGVTSNSSSSSISPGKASETSRSQSSSSVAECDSTSTVIDHLCDKISPNQNLPVIHEIKQEDCVFVETPSLSAEIPNSEIASPMQNQQLNYSPVPVIIPLVNDFKVVLADFKHRLLSQPPWRFVANVSAILDMLLSDNKMSLDDTCQLCIELGPLTSSTGINFAMQMQDYFLKIFKNFHQIVINSKPKAWTNDPDLRTILDDINTQSENALLRKYLRCTKLIGRLYSMESLPFGFVMTFLETLIRTNNEDLYLAMLEMLELMSGYASDLEWQAIANQQCDQVRAFFDDLSHRAESSPTVKCVVREIFLSRENGFCSLTPQQSTERRLRLLLSAVTIPVYLPSYRITDRQQGVAISRLRTFLNDCPPECSQPVLKTLCTTIQELASISSRQDVKNNNKRAAESASITEDSELPEKTSRFNPRK